jgi:hypothetical protein
MKPKPLLLPLDRRQWLSLGDLSRACGYAPSTLRRMIARGEIPTAFRGYAGKGRKWRIGRADAERWWADMQQQPIN